MPYDELGNYIPGYDPTLDEMRYELAKPTTPSGRRQETEAEYKARMVNQLPPAFGVEEFRPPYVEPYVPPSTAKSALGQVLDRTGITALPQAALSILSSYPSAVATEMGNKELGNKLQYEPTSRHANEIVERLGKAMEVAKIPAYIAHIPMARPYMTPDDVRVMGANVAKTGREIRDIPSDFVNAQSGLKRQDVFGQPTLGTRLQGAAENIGDVMARREMQGLSAVPGIPATLVPETKMYAVRPAGYGQIIEQSDLPGKPNQYASSNIDTVRDIIEDIRPPIEDGNPGHKIATYERNFFSPIDGLRETMRQLEFAKIKEMYPDAPTEADAVEAYRNSRTEREQIDDKLNWYDEFRTHSKVEETVTEYNYGRHMLLDDLKEAKMQKKKGLPDEQKREIDNEIMDLEEQLRRYPPVDLPSRAEYERRIKAADRYLNTEFKNEIKKYIGTAEGPMMNLAKKGITFKPAEEIIQEAADVKQLRSREGSGLRVEGEIALAREKAGFNPKGETGPLVESSEAKLTDAQTKLDTLNSEKFALREQHLLENPDIPDPAQNPGPLGEQYRALTNKIESAASARDKAKKELDNFRLANAYELLSDYAYVPMTAGELKGRLPYAQRVTAFPNLAKTPDDAQMFNVRETMINNAMGLKDAGDRYAEAILRGEIPLDKNDRPTQSFEKFIEENTELRRKKEDYERALESRKVELLDSYAKNTVKNIPDNLQFGNAAVLELTKDTPFNEVRRQISYDGSVFDHCVAASDAPHPGTNPYTGQRYSYSFPVDPATGIERTSKSSSYMDQVKNGNTMLASLRDKTTGMPAGTLEFKNRDDSGTYKIGYVSSYKNDPISAEYRNDLRDYLNTRSDIIRDVDQGMAALYKSGVYDTRGTKRQLENIGLSSRDIEILQNSDHPRFITSEDMAKLRSAPDESRNGLMTERENIAQELADAEDRLVRWREIDPDDAETHQHIEATIDDYRSQLQDIDQRIARQNVPAVQGERLPSNEQIRRNLREGQVSEVRAAYNYIVDAERFADDFNWDHESHMRAVDAIRNNGDLNATVLQAEDVRMIQQMNPQQRELLARELEQNFIVNMDNSLGGGVVSLADFEGEVPGITRFYEDARARAEGQLANPAARETVQAEPNANAQMVLQSARNEAFGTLDEMLRRDAENIVDMATLNNADNLPAIYDAVTEEANAIYNGQRFAHLNGDQQMALVRALNNFTFEIAPPPQARPTPAVRETRTVENPDRFENSILVQAAQNDAFGPFDDHIRGMARDIINDSFESYGTALGEFQSDISSQARRIESREAYPRITDQEAHALSRALNEFLGSFSERQQAPQARQAVATTTDLNQALQESFQTARGLHTNRHVDSALDAVNDISNDIDLTDNPTEFISRVRGRAENSQPEVSAVLNNIADDLEGAHLRNFEPEEPARPVRRVRRVTGEPGSLTRVMNHAVDEFTNEATGSLQSYTSFMNDLEGQDRDLFISELARAINRTADNQMYNQGVMDQFNVDSPAGVRQLNRAFQYTFDNLPQRFADGGLVQRFKEGGSVTDDISTYSQTFDNPDSSKTTESGIIKKFEEDYLKFAMQRHERPKQEFSDQTKPQSNLFAEYGTPAMGGMVSGRITKMGAMPESYMGDLSYRTPVGPGMAHVGVSGMKTPQYTGVSNVNAGYGVPLGENGFAGVNVAQPTQGGKPIYNAQVQYRKRFAEGGEVSVDEMRYELLRNR